MKLNKSIFLSNLFKKKRKVPLKFKIIKKKIYLEYSEFLIQYHVEKNEIIKGFLLLPNSRKKKYPAVLCHHEHASNYNFGKSDVVGKTKNKNLAYAKELVKKGFVTLAYDSIGFEDRNWHPTKKPWWGIEYYELVSRLIKGKTLFNKLMHDASCAVSVLCSLKFVDKKNIGFIGHSFGGRIALFLPSYDNRIKVSFSNCYCVRFKSNLQKNLRLRLPMELCIPGIYKYFDIEDLIAYKNNCLFYISVCKKDKWSIDGLKVYKILKKMIGNDRIQFKEWEYEHTFNKEMREEAYSFLKKNLCAE